MICIQVILRWGVQRGVPMLPRSKSKERVIENSLIFDFRLTDAEMALIDGLDGKLPPE
jgi:diketogulonate reductase-like aldo/keto reductase